MICDVSSKHLLFWNCLLKSSSMLHGQVNHHFKKCLLTVSPYSYYTTFTFLSTRVMITNRAPPLSNVEPIFKIVLIGLSLLIGCGLVHETWKHGALGKVREMSFPLLLWFKESNSGGQAIRARSLISWTFRSLESKCNVTLKVFFKFSTSSHSSKEKYLY